MQYAEFTTFVKTKSEQIASELTPLQISENLDDLTDYVMDLSLDYQIFDAIFKQYQLIDPDDYQRMAQLSITEATEFDRVWDQHPGLRWYQQTGHTFQPIDIATYLDVMNDVNTAITNQTI